MYLSGRSKHADWLVKVGLILDGTSSSAIPTIIHCEMQFSDIRNV